MASGVWSGFSDRLGDNAGCGHVGAGPTTAGAVRVCRGAAVAAAAGDSAVRIGSGTTFASRRSSFEGAKRRHLGSQTEILIVDYDMPTEGSRVSLPGAFALV